MFSDVGPCRFIDMLGIGPWGVSVCVGSGDVVYKYWICAYVLEHSTVTNAFLVHNTAPKQMLPEPPRCLIRGYFLIHYYFLVRQFLRYIGYCVCQG